MIAFVACPVEMETKTWNIQEKDITFDRSNIIAVGGAATVHSGVWAGIDVAVKVLRVQLNSNVLQELQSETEIMVRLHHKNIIQLYGVCTESSMPLMVLEFADGGSLYNYLQVAPQDINVEIAHNLISQISIGMQYLHSRDPPVIHGDLKSVNCLLQNVQFGIEHCLVKISDFGMSKLKSITNSSKTKGNVSGTLRWLAPERFKGGKLTEAVDIFAFGMTCYEVMSVGKLPFELNGFEDDSDAPIVGAIISGIRPLRPPETNTAFTDVHWNLVEDCWQEEPKSRPTFATITETLRRIKSESGMLQTKDQNVIISNAELAPLEPSSNNRYISKADISVAAGSASQNIDTSETATSNDNPYIFASHSPLKVLSTDNNYITRSTIVIPALSSPTESSQDRSDDHNLKDANIGGLVEVIPDIASARRGRKSKPTIRVFGRFTVNRNLFLTTIFVAVVILIVVIAVVFARNQPPSNPPIGSIVRNYTGHTGKITSIYVSESSSEFLTGSSDSTIRVWDSKAGKTSQILRGATGDVFSIIKSSSGFFYSASTDSLVRQWNATSGINTFSFNISPNISAMACSPASFDCIYGQCVKEYGNGDGISVSPYSYQKLIVGANGTLIEVNYDAAKNSFNLNENQFKPDFAPLFSYLGENASLYAIEFLSRSSSGSGSGSLFAGSANSILKWDLQVQYTSSGSHSAAFVRRYSGHTNLITHIAAGYNTDFTPYLISGSADKTIKIWNAESGLLLQTIATNGVSALSILPAILPQTPGLPVSPMRLFIGSPDAIIREWNITDGTLIRNFTGHSTSISYLITRQRTYNNTARLFSGSEDGQVIEWSI